MDSLVEIFDSIKNNDILRLNNILNTNQNLINKYLYGVTPFLYAIECGNENIALELCKRGDINFSLKDNLDFNCLEKSVESKMYNLSEIICTKNKALNLDEILIDKETILTRSLKNEDSNVCKVLINGRINVNKPNDMGEYPLQIAIRLNKIDAVKEMLKKNDVYINSLENGYNPLLDACEKDLTEIALLLIENGADLNVQDKDQLWSPLMHSISNNNETILLKLIEKNCDVNKVDMDGNNALHLAVLSENEYLLKYLLKMAPNKNALNKENQTPLDLAKLSEDEIIINILSQ